MLTSRAFRRSVQTAAFLTFLILFIASRRGVWDPVLINLPIRLDPLNMLANGLSSRIWQPAAALALITVILTLVFGRVWCGFLCPLGSILDLFRPRRYEQHAPDDKWRNFKYILLLVILTAAFFGSLTLLVFDPLNILFRTLSVSVWPGLDRLVTALETALYQVPFLQQPLSAIDQIIRPVILPPAPVYYRNTAFFLVIFTVILCLNLFAARFWCRYLCPLGGLLGLISKLAIFQRKVGGDCRECGLCSRRCPTGTIQPGPGYESDPAECIMCLDCLRECPDRATSFPPSLPQPGWESYNPTRRQALAAGGLTVAALAVAGAEPFNLKDHPFLIQPPGGRTNDLLNKCVRCGECSRACPTSAIQPAVAEAGWTGFWSPILIMRLGYCDYSCNACGQVCPVGAIPPLDLAEKRLQIIGKAKIDRDRCVAWAENRTCIVCEEMCPLPEKAIILQAPENLEDAKLPEVVYDLCIGCGICETKCPAYGESAIRVFSVRGNA
jgi:polyferredoxin/Pyruvate/2-oxoacid:ferredoxin oxidoreductase delta subunit